VAPRIEGQVGSSEVEFTSFSYQACSCGALARWAFDPGLEFSEQLFYDGVPTADGRRGTPTCRSCRTPLDALEEINLSASAHLEGFQPIGMNARLLGYRCPSCGLSQAPPHEFDIGTRSTARLSDTGKALDAAINSIGLTT
jgi:hypothetical protein